MICSLYFMGMCSRRERIQKDVDIVIQRCEAEQDCLFSDFRFTDATFTFTFSNGSKRVSYSVHVSEDYPDNTCVSNSENIDDVLVTRDPIPVIFHRITTEVRINSNATSCLPFKSKLEIDKNQFHSNVEEDSEGEDDSDGYYYGGQVNYAGELCKHPQLESDLAAVRALYGPNAVSLREYDAIDDVDIDLRIDVSFLDEDIACAWDLIRREALIIRLHCSLSQYLNGPEPTVDVFQESTKERFGIRHQLKQIMQTFVRQQCKYHCEEKLNCSVSKKLSDKTVKSPLHIFSTLRRSPSYPPYGYGKANKKLKSEADAVSESESEAELLHTTQDGCAGRPHRALELQSELSPSVRPRALSESCPTAGETEDCASLRPHSFLDQLQEPWEQDASGLLWGTEEQDLQHHRLGRPEPGPGPEGRRLSLTSGLLGVLSAAPNYGAKSIPVRDQGFLVQTMKYAEQRIPVLSEYCVVCDEAHIFLNGPMLRPTVCERELCVFAFQTLGVMNKAADEIATGAQVVDLLVSMCRSALQSQRKDIVFSPYPSVVDPNNRHTLAFNPKIKDYDRVERALGNITSIREMTQTPCLEMKKQLDKRDPLAYPLLQWVISSNRSHIVKLPASRQLKFMRTPHQFLLLCSPPAKESNFRAAKRLYGSTFAFHGSHIENWHSILRNGLVVASKTRLQSQGKGDQPLFLQDRNLKCIALCEVITSPQLKKHGVIWVVPDTDNICTRFFFVYEYGLRGNPNVNTQDDSVNREILRVIGNQTATG
ncbi:protein mono-ADP-ribosyltransferase PARP8-like isoform X2 [Conger conger]|uniref:protein mono-ADP-ribosyltransferase PARP8-like isoform X2 n=1 Tax=Conger conger TaxID=82655 RepID=UPI002A5A0EE6|nr:protein mono-ADP-ribosyltransferase PARP8-like isoform X2 [Conger conger]